MPALRHVLRLPLGSVMVMCALKQTSHLPELTLRTPSSAEFWSWPYTAATSRLTMIGDQARAEGARQAKGSEEMPQSAGGEQFKLGRAHAGAWGTSCALPCP